MRTTTLIGPLALLLSVASGAAHASSDDAWAAFDQDVTRACIAASGIQQARPSTIVGFDDRVGVVAMLVEDRTRGSSTAKLCLYDKKSKQAYVDQADAWSAPPQPRPAK
ncbi:hypothetical protein [Biostraticola tofi]|uniref:Uncharacterized protein n=1 Tax=Biostraticola tofi TaxID=466109 RepID=A0A4R3YW98_9GAMM|nr:hypothetical protein [Biostraticola tofi]TCV96776.1 hypothetical protein EDC52_104216 [Biostraticola tofi]